MNERPFGHREAGDLTRLRLTFPLQGQAYRFTLLLPVLDVAGNTLFTPAERTQLRQRFAEDFGGYTCDENIVQPLVAGGYLDVSGEHVIDRHTRFEVLTKQTPEAMDYFEDLAKDLARYSRAAIAQRIPGYRGEEQIFVEVTPVVILHTWLAFDG